MLKAFVFHGTVSMNIMHVIIFFTAACPDDMNAKSCSPSGEGAVVNECLPGHTKTSATTCGECDAKCAPGSCTAQNENVKCSKCLDGSYLKTDHTCGSCASKCEKCSSSDTCSKCKEKYGLDGNNACISEFFTCDFNYLSRLKISI